MATQKLSSHEDRVTSRLSENLLRLQVVNPLKCLLRLRLLWAFPLFRAILRASAPLGLVREAATEVRIKLPIQLWLHQHHPQRIKASAGCCVLAVPFSFGG